MEEEVDPSLPRAASAYPASSQDLDEVRGVWVDLETLFPTDTAAAGGEDPVAVAGGLMTDGEVHGLLHRWVRGQDGRWIAIVSYRLPYADAPASNSPGIEARRVPVPAAAAPTKARPAASRHHWGARHRRRIVAMDQSRYPAGQLRRWVG